jgi:double-strand break repair protein MRE11
MGLALQEFLDKDEREAIKEIVKLQLHDTQKALSTKNLRGKDIVQEVVKETERSRTEELSQEEEARTRKVFFISNSQYLNLTS